MIAYDSYPFTFFVIKFNSELNIDVSAWISSVYCWRCLFSSV